METLRGKVTKIKIIKYLTNGTPLVRFNVDDTNCLIAFHSLNFLFEVNEDAEIVVGGEYNSRGQFVVKRYCVRNKELKI